MEKNKEIKVAFIIFSLQAGGAERNILNFLKYNNDPHLKPLVITIKNTYDYAAEYSNEKKYVITLLKDNKITAILKPFKFLEIFIKLFFIIRKKNIDILIGGAEYLPFYLVTLLKLFLNKKTVLIVGNNIIAENLERQFIIKYFNDLLFKICFFYADAIICVSKGLAQKLKEYYDIDQKKIHSIYNGLEIKRIYKESKKPLSKKLELLFKRNYVLITLGRLAYKKGYIHLINSFKIVKKKHDQCKLIFIGKGEEEKSLKMYAKEKNLSKDIIFLGFARDNPYKYLSKADLFLFTSLFEGFGNTIVEALCCEVPIISTNCEFGPAEILDNCLDYNQGKKIYRKYGVLIPSFLNNKKHSDGEENILANQIEQFIVNKKLGSQYKNTSLVRANNFNVLNMIEQYKNLIYMITK